VGKPSDRDDLTSPASNDIIEATDVSDTTQSADGTSKKMTVSALATALDGLGLATDAELATHAALTAAHGIADTSALLTDSDVVDEDDMVSDDDTLIPTQQSVKAYVDTEIAGIVAPQAADVTADSSGLTLITGDDVAEQIAAADALIVGLDAGDLAAVFDDAGDIFVATAADTAAKLPRGTENHVLAATASTIAYKNVYEIPQVVQAARTADFTIAATDVGDVVPVAMALDGEVVRSTTPATIGSPCQRGLVPRSNRTTSLATTTMCRTIAVPRFSGRKSRRTRTPCRVGSQYRDESPPPTKTSSSLITRGRCLRSGR
jgi:hypothetical protein